ncbi:putative Zn-ribbon and HTH transcriptional regulator [Paenibacillus harenae]|nr:putative Zn-ribbon and HTH transcriptional regulator [Paenibacillus harenae]
MKTEKEKMISGELYNAGDAALINDRLSARRLTRLFNQTNETEDIRRMELLKQLFGSTGSSLYVEPTFRCDYGYNIHVESRRHDRS